MPPVVGEAHDFIAIPGHFASGGDQPEDGLAIGENEEVLDTQVDSPATAGVRAPNLLQQVDARQTKILADLDHLAARIEQLIGECQQLRVASNG